MRSSSSCRSMKKLLVYNVNVYPDGGTLIRNGGLLVADGKVEKILQDCSSHLNEEGTEAFDGQGMNLLPGYIDVHVHGGYGYDFLVEPDKALETFSREAVKEGCTGYLASLVCDWQEVLVEAMTHYRDLSEDVPAHCLGVHMEGPFVSTDYKAVMKEETLRMPSLDQFKEMLQASGGNMKQMTIAPELPGALELIKYGSEHGVTMMMGHSGASSEEGRKGLEAGATGTTHFYNAMKQHEHRDPGLVTAGFLYPELINELIVDGFHVHPDIIRATYKILGAERICLITDATLMRGLPDGDYEFSGHHIHKSGIKAQVVETGRISGSVIGMDDAVRNMIKYCGCSLSDIVRMACINPSVIARCQNRKGKLWAGYDADFILLDEENRVKATFTSGRKVY